MLISLIALLYALQHDDATGTFPLHYSLCLG